MEPLALVKQAQSLRRAAIDGAEERWEERIHLLTRAVSLARASEDPEALAQSLMSLGQLERDRNDLASAYERYREASAICRGATSPLLLAHALRHMAEMRREAGALDEARPLYNESLALYLDNGRPLLDVANTYRGIALLHEATGDAAGARQAWAEAERGYEAWRGAPG